MTDYQAPIEIVSYDPVWAHQFEELREALAEKLRALTLGIEHVGSTAIPELSAKPNY